MKRRFFLACISLLPAFFACKTSAPTTPPLSQPSPAALGYFEQAFALIQKNAYFHKQLNSRTLKRQALEKMSSAQTYADTYEAIRFVIDQLQDHHSFLLPPAQNGQNAFRQAIANDHRIPFESSLLEGQYGLLRLRSYNSVNHANSHRISDSLYSCLAEFGRRRVKGLILDMRMMEGGTPTPFLAGLAPLIDAKQLIGSINRAGKRSQTIRYKSGIYHKEGRKQVRLGYLSVYAPLEVAGLPLAILTGQYTASSGEMIVISFLGLPNVKLFGRPTFGVPTGKMNLCLADSALLSITNSVSYDRQQVVHSGPIQPDVVCSEKEAPQLAQHWINTLKP